MPLSSEAAAGNELGVGLFEALRCAHCASVEVAAFCIATLIVRGNDLFAELGTFAESRLNHVRGGVVAIAQLTVMRGEVQPLLE